MHGVVAALRRRRSRTASRDRPGRRRACCCGPCGSCGRSGGSAAGRGRRSRARRSRGTCSSTAFRPPHERGNSSYQAQKRARTRSTSIGSGGSQPWSRRGARRARSTASSSSGASAASNLAGSAAASAQHVERALERALRSAPRSARSAASSSSTRALGELAGEVVLPGVDLALQLVAPGGERRRSRPRSSTPSGPACRRVNAPSQRTPLIVGVDARASAPRASAGRRAPCSARRRAAISWPSRKTSAATVDRVARRSASAGSGRRRPPAAAG